MASRLRLLFRELGPERSHRLYQELRQWQVSEQLKAQSAHAGEGKTLPAKWYQVRWAVLSRAAWSWLCLILVGLLVRLFEHARDHGAALMTLEVAASNHAARQLYAKYGFDVVGERRAYYEATGEDAVIMTTPLLEDPTWRDRFARLRAALGMRDEASAAGD